MTPVKNRNIRQETFNRPRSQNYASSLHDQVPEGPEKEQQQALV
jgi:hypothetical protein